MSRKKPEAVPQHELLLWTRRFSAMIDCGVSLMRCMDALSAEETTPAMRDITRTLMTAVEQGATLSDAMSGERLKTTTEGLERTFTTWATRMRQTFDPDYVATVRVGEVGGILDVAFDRLVDRYERGLAPLPPPKGGELPRAELAEWFWRFGAMLQAGVPLLFALETLKRVSRPPLEQISQEMRDEIHAGMALLSEKGEEPSAMRRYPGVFTPTLLHLFGPAYEALQKVVVLLEKEAQLEQEGKLPPLSTEPTGERPPEFRGDAREGHPVVRQVNDLYVTAIKAEADWISLSLAEEGGGKADLSRNGQVVKTIPLEHYAQCVRRIKVNADIDPFTQEDRRSQIHVRYQDKTYVLYVHSRPTFRGGYLTLSLRPEEKAVEL